MNAKAQYMEHRWGTRIELDAAAKLMTGEGVCAGVLRNASLSGAFIETNARPTLLSRVSVRAAAPGAEWLDSCVVRVEPRGVAVEWLDPPLHSVAMLLALHSVKPSAVNARESRPKPAVMAVRPRTPAQAGTVGLGG